MKKLGGVAILVVALTAVSYAVAIVANAAFAVQGLLDPSSRADGMVIMAWLLASSAALFGAAYFLMRNRESLADRWFDDEGVAISVSEQGLIRVGLVMLGLVLLAWGIPDLIGTLSRLVTASVQQRMLGLDEVQSSWDRIEGVRALVVVTLKLFIGGVLVSKNAPFSRALWSPGSDRPASASAKATCTHCGGGYDPDDYTDLATARCIECHQPLGVGL